MWRRARGGLDLSGDSASRVSHSVSRVSVRVGPITADNSGNVADNVLGESSSEAEEKDLVGLRRSSYLPIMGPTGMYMTQDAGSEMTPYPAERSPSPVDSDNVLSPSPGDGDNVLSPSPRHGDNVLSPSPGDNVLPPGPGDGDNCLLYTSPSPRDS